MKISEIKILCFLPVLAGTSTLTAGGCRQAVADSPAAEHRIEKMVIILPGMIEDQSWNKINYEGILKCREILGADLESVQNVTENDFGAILTEYGSQDYGLVVAAGSQFDDVVSAVVPRFPDTTFCVVNGFFCQGRNVVPILPKGYEAGYLAFIIAGNIIRSGIFGIIAGYPNAPMEHFLDAHEKDVMDIISQRRIENPQTLGSYANSQSSVDLGKKIVEQMIDSRANTSFIYANEVGLRCIQAVKKRQVKVIGFSGNQNGLEPGTVAVSVYFDFGTLYRWTVEQYIDGKLQGNKIREIDIREGIFAPALPEGTPEGLKDTVDQGTSDFLKGKVDLTQWSSD